MVWFLVIVGLLVTAAGAANAWVLSRSRPRIRPLDGLEHAQTGIVLGAYVNCEEGILSPVLQDRARTHHSHHRGGRAQSRQSLTRRVWTADSRERP